MACVYTGILGTVPICDVDARSVCFVLKKRVDISLTFALKMFIEIEGV